jgi:hypothetical protein
MRILRKRSILKVSICDFGASLNYTHHYHFILARLRFLSRNYSNISVSVLLPIGSEIESGSLGNANIVKKVLLPITHFPRTKYKKIGTWFTFFWRHLGTKLGKSFKTLWVNTTLVCALSFFIIKKSDVIIFPTACPQSIKLIQLLEFLRFKTSIHLHFSNTSEVRKPFGSESTLKLFINKANEFKFIKVVFSCESLEFQRFYSEFTKNNSMFFARPPSIGHRKNFDMPSRNYFGNAKLNILILGRPGDAQRNSLISNSLNQFNLKFPVNTHFETINFGIVADDSFHVAQNVFIDNVSVTTEKLTHKFSFEKLVEKINAANIVILPYNPITYSMRHSALVMLLSDLGIPIISCAGAAFSKDIAQFKLGKLFDFQADFSNSLIESIFDPMTYGFNEYCRVREEENISMYNLLGFERNRKV